MRKSVSIAKVLRLEKVSVVGKEPLKVEKAVAMTLS